MARGRSSLSADEARRLALAAQGFAAPRPRSTVDRRHVRRVFASVGLLQIDSVNVLVRSHELPLFSRLGPYQRSLVHTMAADGELFEYWGHEASLLPVQLQPLLRWRMRDAARHHGARRIAEIHRDRPDYLARVLDHVRTHGPTPARALDDGTARGGPWWGWKDHKIALELLFAIGEVSARRKANNFERLYDLVDRIIPPAVLDAPTPLERDAQRELLRRSVTHLGVATVRDAADYFRIRPPVARPLLDELAAEGLLAAVDVEGWNEPAFLDPDASIPRRVAACALLSPFDSLVWARPRTERIFGFRYRLEIYTPEHLRTYGYYVLPFLLGDRLVARVDLKADRRQRVLRVLGAFAETGHAPAPVAQALAHELVMMSQWLGLDAAEVTPEPRGDLVVALRASLGAT